MHREDKAGMELVIQPNKLARYLLPFAILLGTIDVLFQTVDQALSPGFPGWVQAVKMFDLDREFAFPTWYSIILMAVVASVLALIAWSSRQAGDSMWRYWGVLAIIFAVFSMDEQVVGHESVGQLISEQVDTGGLLYYAWVIPGIVAVIIAGLLFVPFIRYLSSATRKRMLVAGGLYIGGVLVMEMISGYVADSRGVETLLYQTITSCEEILELLGISYFLIVLVAEVARRVPRVEISIKRPETSDAST